MFASTVLVLYGASGASFDPDALGSALLFDAEGLPWEGAAEAVDAVELAERTREAVQSTEDQVVVLWMGDVDRWTHTVDGVPVADFWSPDATASRLTILEVDSSYTVIEGLQLRPVAAPVVRVPPPPLKQIGPWVDNFWVPDATAGGVVFSGSGAVLPPTANTSSGAQVLPLLHTSGVWQLSVEDLSGRIIGDLVVLLPSATVESAPIASMNGFAAGHEYWRWTSGPRFASEFVLRPTILGGAGKLGGPWEAHPYMDFSGGPPVTSAHASDWWQAENAGGAMDLWIGRTQVHSGSSSGPAWSGTPYGVGDTHELLWMAHGSALVGGRVDVTAQDPLVLRPTGAPGPHMLLSTMNTGSLP